MAKDTGPRSFVHFLEAASDGALKGELDEQLHELVRKLRDESLARDVNAKGELMLKLKFTAEPNGIVRLAYDVKTKLPPKAMHPGIFWLTESGNLSAENPRQPSLPGIREVPKPREDAREIEGAKVAPKEA